MKKQKTIFVAGASGAIGKRLCRMLVKDGWSVVGTTRYAEKTSMLAELGVEPVIVDVFDEETGTSVIAEMPGIEEGDINCEIKGDILKISAEGKERKYQKEILLSRPARAEEMTWSYKADPTP